MSQTTTLVLLPQTTYNGGPNANVYTVTGNTKPAAAYYLGNRDLQTVNINLTNVVGNIVIEASLATTPSANTDWFKVYELEANANAPANSAPQIASNASVYTNIEGNFVYLRAKVEDFAYGIVNFVKLSY
jgi:hypothetical protein